MPIKHTIISDITWKELKKDYIHIYKSFWYNSDFDTWTLSIYIDKEELEKLFWSKIKDNKKVGFCDICNKDIIKDVLVNVDKSFSANLDWFKDLLDERSLTIKVFDIDLCNDCIKKYFEKYIKYENDLD